MNLIRHIERQRAFSQRTFGPGTRTEAIIDHIQKELKEIAAAPTDINEWVDVILLAIDGAWRAGYEPEYVAAAIAAKLAKNEVREWPDWHTQPLDKAIEHVRDEEA